MDKHEFSRIITEGLKKRKIDKIRKADGNFYGYIQDRTIKVQKEHSRLKKS